MLTLSIDIYLSFIAFTIPGCVHTQSCSTLYDPMHCTPPSSPANRIFQARILEWVAISSSKESSWHRDKVHVSCISCISCIDRQILYHWATLLDLNAWGVYKSSYSNSPSCWKYWNWSSEWFKVSHPLSWTILYNETVESFCYKLQFSSFTQSCLTLYKPMDCSTPTSLHHQLQSLLNLMSIVSGMSSNHILCHHLLLLSSIFPSIREWWWVSSSHQVAKV